MTLADCFDLALRHYGPGLWLLLAVIAAELLNLVSLRRLNGLGIVPRESAGLAGIVCAPFLHDSVGHFLANLLPLFILGYALGQFAPGHFWWVTAALVLGTGALVWAFARRRNHLGASGLVYGLLGYLTLSGFLSGQLLYMAGSAVLLLMYSGVLWGVLPTTARTSWESHLFGLAAGLGLAWWRVL